MINSIKNKWRNYSILETESFYHLSFVTLVLFSISLRFFHLGEIIDDPHSWRQCDTANYIWDFYKNGVDFLHPAVCWMGGYKTLILEFPLTEALIAWLYQIFEPSTIIARLFFLFFYTLGVFYFYKNCAFFLQKKTAMFSTIIYTFLPLSYYYSRALHIDFFALSFAMGMNYYYLVGIKEQKVKKIVIGSLFATIAFLVKVPYAISFCFPLIYFITKEKKWPFCLKWTILFVYPDLLFAWWTFKSNAINSLAPDWHFIQGYRKFDDNFRWYFGTLEHRFVSKNWSTLFDRLVYDLSAGYIGTGFFLIGVCVSIFRKKYSLLWYWFLGVIVYLLIFFFLNVIHNYYQIPFVPLFAIFMAIGIEFLADFLESKNSILIQLFFLVTLCITAISFSEKSFFKQEIIYEDIGKQIAENSNENDLLIVSYGKLSVHCPLILYRAKRNGWSIPIDVINEKIVTNLCKEGCKYLAFIEEKLPKNDFGNFLKLYPMKTIPLQNGNKLFLIDLKTKKRLE